MRVRAGDLRGLIRHEAAQAAHLDHALSDSHSRLLAAVRGVAAQLQEDRDAARRQWDELADGEPGLAEAYGSMAATERSLAALTGSLQSGLAEDVDKLFGAGRWDHPELLSRRHRIGSPGQPATAPPAGA